MCKVRPTATEFTAWLFLDCAFRQDAHGRGVARARRRYRKGCRLMIQSIGLLKIMSSSEVWGICYQDNNKRVRGDDILYRLTLAVMAFEQDGCSTRAACNVVVAEPAVKRKMGYKGLANESDSLRVSIIRY